MCRISLLVVFVDTMYVFLSQNHPHLSILLLCGLCVVGYLLSFQGYFLLDNGFYEVINPPFVSISSNKSIKVDNPLDSNREFLRTNITNSLLDNLLFNERRQKNQ